MILTNTDLVAARKTAQSKGHVMYPWTQCANTSHGCTECKHCGGQLVAHCEGRMRFGSTGARIAHLYTYGVDLPCTGERAAS